MAIPKKVVERLTSKIKGFQTVLEQQKARDVSEADTVTVVKDILNAVFGYDKYAELTSEHAIRGTYCDLAVRIDGKLAFLLEVKAVGLDLKDKKSVRRFQTALRDSLPHLRRTLLTFFASPEANSAFRIPDRSPCRSCLPAHICSMDKAPV